MILKKRLILVIVLIIAGTLLFAEGEQQFIQLGNFSLESGEIIKDCRIGYRTFGKLNQDKSNIILYPSWYGGTSEHLGKLIGPGKLVDSSRFYVIAVDALGNGVSSSPSNSKRQRGDKFPVFTIRDMVRTQYELLTKELGVDHIYGIIGGSMGSFQAFEWLVMYPNFMDKAVAYVCTPQFTSYDLLLLSFELELIEAAQSAKIPEKTIQRLGNIGAELFARTPAYRVKHTSRSEFDEFMEKYDKEASVVYTSDDKASQLRAMKSQDVFAHFDGSMEKAAEAIRADVLMIVSETDHMVNPQPAIDFARVLECDLVVLENNCGHLALGCEMDRCIDIINQFFNK
ncbi:MAG: alpha/beta fold hydrolase [Candidatus Marinimicrobia bacterium]|nr:alpha/beta fold hydrolase [Candidatus Neomarinimicrobiota bacterium]